MSDQIMPEGVASMTNPLALVATEVDPMLPLEGPIAGPMVSLTMRYALLEDIINSFGDRPPAPDHHVPGEQTVQVLMVLESAETFVRQLGEACALLREVTRQNPSE